MIEPVVVHYIFITCIATVLLFGYCMKRFFLVLFVVHNLICFVSPYGRFGRGISILKKHISYHTLPVSDTKQKSTMSAFFHIGTSLREHEWVSLWCIRLMRGNMGSNEHGTITSIYENTSELGREHLSASEDEVSEGVYVGWITKNGRVVLCRLFALYTVNCRRSSNGW